MQDSMHKLSEDVLKRVKSKLQIVFGQRLQGLILYGSEARHEADRDSDIDFLVLLTGPVDQGEDSWTCIRALYPLVLELERPIHAKPVDIKEYEAQVWPLYQSVKEEGVLV
jgi:predicted nucleotidyltransferase